MTHILWIIFWSQLYGQHIESSKAAQDGTLPKILLSDGFLPFNLKRIVVFTDYDLINQAFKNPVFSTKSGPIGATDPKTKLDFATERTESGLRKYISDIQLQTGNTEKALNSNFGHIGTRLNCKPLKVPVTRSAGFLSRFVLSFWFPANAKGAGDYDQNHILLRKRWHAATSRLLGKNKIDEMCHFSANQISK